MSWDATLTDDRGHVEGDWNYTHNTNRMVHEAIAGHPDTVASGLAWWQTLNGMDGPAGAAFLHRIISCLEADPDKYRAMNPENGWGDYDTLVKVLTEMRNAVPEWPTYWSTSG